MTHDERLEIDEYLKIVQTTYERLGRNIEMLKKEIEKIESKTKTEET